MAFVGVLFKVCFLMTPALEMGTGTEQYPQVALSVCIRHSLSAPDMLASFIIHSLLKLNLHCVLASGYHSVLAINVGLLSAKLLCVISFVFNYYSGCEQITLSQRYYFHLALRFITGIF